MKRKYFLLCTVLLLANVISGCKKTNDDGGVTTAVSNGDLGVTISAEPTAVAATAAPTATHTPTETVSSSQSTSASSYKDGVYDVKTPLDNEKYYTEASVIIQEGKITSVDWTIYDSGHDNKPFDKDYYHVMEQYSDLYVQQAKDDWTGSRDYSDSLIETQDVDKVDAVSGATWTNIKFKEVVEMALNQAKTK